MGKSPQEWQTEAAARAAQENLIVFAETGAGKTMVAELAIKDALLRQPSKRCAFLVTATRLLAHQQWQRIRQSLEEDGLAMESDDVVEVTGYTTSEWDESAWSNCFERAKVLVGTIETFARAVIDHGYLQLKDFSLLVVDEAHKVVGDSPGAELLLRLSQESRASCPRPRCLGLTASYANDGAKTWEDFLQSRRTLQAIFEARLHVCTVPPRKKPRFEKIEYAPVRLASEAKSAAAVVCQCLWQELRKADLKEPKEAERLTQQLSELLTELGRDGFEVGLFEGLLAQIEGRIDNFSKIVETKRSAERYKADLQQLKLSLQRAAESVKNMDALRSFESRSEKLQALVQRLHGEFYQYPPQVEDSCGMVFVSQVALALPLARLLGQALPGVAVGAVSGVSSMTEEQRNAAFSSFRLGRTRLLVCTTCAEEGMDVAKCSFVVRFNQFHTTRSHVQGVGRARAEEARIYYFDNCPSAECHLAEVMQAVAWEPTEEAPVTPLPVPPYGRVSAVHPFRAPNSTAEVNLRSAPRILARYLSQTSGDSFKDLQFPGGLLLPGPHGGIKLMESDVCAFMASHDCDLKTSLKYVAVLALHRRGWLDRHNGVPRPVIAGAQAWQKSIGAAEEVKCFELTFMVSQSHRRLSGGRERLGGSSMLEQVDLGLRRLKPEEIQNTQLTVNRSFTNGGSVRAAMAALVTGAKRIEDFPLIRVAWSESGQRWYSADNRRLFIFKVVAPLLDLEDVEVAVINWTWEFDCKNNQKERFGEVWATHATSVAQVRHQLLEAIARGDDLGSPESPDDAGSQSPQIPLPDPALSAPICADSEGEAEQDLSSAYHLPAAPSRNVRRLESGDLELGNVRTLRSPGPEARAEILQLQIEAFREQAEEHEKLMELLRPLNVNNFEQIRLNMSSCIAEAVRLSLIDDAEKTRLQAIDDRGTCAKHRPESLRANSGGQDALSAPEDDPTGPEGLQGPRCEPVEVIHGEDATELLRRVGQSLAKSQNRQEEVAVSLLKEVLERHCRLNNNQKLPLDFELLESQEGFRMAVVVAGRRFEASEGCSTKKEAKRKAAVAAIDGLIRGVGHGSSPRSDSERSSDSWEVLEDYEICEAQGGGDYLRVELLLEPDHATSCQCFRPKEQLFEHLQQLMGRAPTKSECRFAFKGWQSFWRCRVQLHCPLLELSGSFEGTPAQTPEQAEQNAAWRVLEKLKLIKVVQLHKDQELQEALRTLPNASNLELVQDGCVVSGDVRVSQLSCLRFEVRDAEPW